MDFFGKYNVDINKNRGLAGTTTNLVFLPNNIIINAIRHMIKTDKGMKTVRYLDFFNIDGDYLLTIPGKEIGVDEAYTLAMKSDSEGNLWISYVEPYPHVVKYSVQFKEK